MVEPFADSFHLDASDGVFAPTLLFFPDLVEQIRGLTPLPLHVHLMAQRPEPWIDAFARAGANRITVHHGRESHRERIRKHGCEAGLAIGIDEPLYYVRGYSSVTLMGTRIGIKGADLHPAACNRIRAMDRLLREAGLRDSVRIYADGGIRKQTVPLLREAGADGIVPGSLVFGSSDMAGTFAWLRSL